MAHPLGPLPLDICKHLAPMLPRDTLHSLTLVSKASNEAFGSSLYANIDRPRLASLLKLLTTMTVPARNRLNLGPHPAS